MNNSTLIFKSSILFFLLFSNLLLVAQDTIYYDSNREIVSPDKAIFYSINKGKINIKPYLREELKFYSNRKRKEIDCQKKNGQPYEGTCLDGFKSISLYKNGMKNGKQSIYNKVFLRKLAEINYTNDTVDGEFILLLSDTIYKGIVEKGIPKSGYVPRIKNKKQVELDWIFSFKDGKVDGPYFRLDENYNKMAAGFYLNEKKHGKYFEKFIYDDALTLRGEYKNGSPQNGVFNNYRNGNVISEFKNGKKISETEYSLYIRIKTKKIFATGETIAYDMKNGKIIARGIQKDGKPYEGLFFKDNGNFTSYKDGMKNGVSRDSILPTNYSGRGKLKTYKNDILEGKYVEYYKDEILAEGNYKEGKPYEGFFFNEKKIIVQYKNGKIFIPEGIVTEKHRLYSVDFSMVNGKKEGQAIFKVPNFKLTTNGNLKNLVPTLYKGMYKNDKPLSGQFIIENKIQTFENGKKNGVEWHGVGSLRNPKTYYTYKNGILHGDYSERFDGEDLKGEFKNGELFTGFKKISPHVIKTKARQPQFIIFEKGKEIIGDTLRFVSRGTMHIKNGKMWEGKYSPFDFYDGYYEFENGRVVRSLERDFILDDTIKTIFKDLKSITLNFKGDTIATTIYQNDFKTGETTFLSNGKQLNVVEFKNGFLWNGNFEKKFYSYRKSRNGTKTVISYIFSFKDGIGKVIFNNPNEPFYRHYYFKKGVIHFPNFANESNHQKMMIKSYKVDYFDKDDDKRIAGFEYGGPKNNRIGTSIDDEYPIYHITYTDGNGLVERKSDLLWEEAKTQLKNWEGPLKK